MSSQPTAAILLSNVLSGGTYRHAKELVREWASHGHRVVFVCLIRRLTRIVVYEKGKFSKEVFLYGDDDQQQLAKIIQSYQVAVLHVEHMLDAPKALIHLHEMAHCSLAVTLHDYYTVCPFIKLVTEDDFYCEEKGCNACLRAREFFSPTFEKEMVDIEEWRSFWHSYLQQAAIVMLPSLDMQQRMKRYFPDLPIRCVENPELVSYRSSSLRVGLIGDLFVAKGSQKIKDTLAYCAAHQVNIRFILFGTLQEVELTEDEKKYIDILGPYQEETVYQQIRSQAIDFFWFPGVCPETYSYTLSIPIRLHIPCISTDLGAIASRIQANHWGATYPWQDGAEAIVKRLLDFPYESYQNPDFVLKNTAFSPFEEYYRDCRVAAATDNPASTVSVEPSFDELLPHLDHKLRLLELSILWQKATIFQKAQLLCHLEYPYYLSKMRSKGLLFSMKKIKQKIFH